MAAWRDKGLKLVAKYPITHWRFTDGPKARRWRINGITYYGWALEAMPRLVYNMIYSKTHYYNTLLYEKLSEANRALNKAIMTITASEFLMDTLRGEYNER